MYTVIFCVATDSSSTGYFGTLSHIYKYIHRFQSAGPTKHFFGAHLLVHGVFGFVPAGH